MTAAENIIIIIRKSMKSLTRKREQILCAVQRLANHPTVGEVYAEVQSRMPNISPATVYRALTWLAEHGYVQRVPGTPRRYDHRRHPHAHVQCRICQRVFDLDTGSEALNGLREEAEKKGFREVTVQLTISGVCRDCVQTHGSGEAFGGQPA